MTSNIPQEQLVELSEAFSLYDLEDSGYIAMDHVDLVLRTLGITFADAALLELKRRKADEGESKVSFEEFLYLVGPEQSTISQFTETHTNHRTAALRTALSVFDTMGYGTITVNELRRALREAMRDHEVDDLVRQVDPQQTGRVSVQGLTELVIGL